MARSRRRFLQGGTASIVVLAVAASTTPWTTIFAK
ncbi:MAG: twin-arginine translocation signal domain-containing protein [Hyphomicrobiales bacterium]|nr:MAG: twin-arginine translocation signal domain-containing protein [Hyphomicrobiales bacterium]